MSKCNNYGFLRPQRFSTQVSFHYVLVCLIHNTVAVQVCRMTGNNIRKTGHVVRRNREAEETHIINAADKTTYPQFS